MLPEVNVSTLKSMMPISVADHALVFGVWLGSPDGAKEITAYSSEIDTSVEKCLKNDRGIQKSMPFS